jgi:hypothetical protein
MPYYYVIDAKTKRKPPQKGLFDHWNQSHTPFEDGRAANACSTRVNEIFFYFHLLKKIAPNPTQ